MVLLVVVLSAALQATPVMAASQAAPRVQVGAPVFEPAGCMFEIPTGWLEGQDVECGWLIVPEEYDNPGGSTIRLAVAVVSSTAENPSPVPLVMLQGGPGGSTIETYVQTIAYLAPHLREYSDIILFDQRGTLYSEPALTCPEVLEVTIDTLNREISVDEENAMSVEAMEACHARLVEEGVNFSAFDSVENAHDVDSLREALGYEQINLYGVSYGTLLAQHVMRLHPEGLRSVVLDSVVPTNINFITEAPQSQKRAFQALFEACAQDEDCDAAFPNLEDVLAEVVDQLNQNPVSVQLKDPETQKVYPALVDGNRFESGLFQMMYATQLIPFIPRVIYDARARNLDFFSTIYAVLTFDRSMSLGMYYAVICAEDADFTPEQMNVEGLEQQQAEVELENAALTLEICEAWDVDPLPGEVDEPVVSDIPTLLMSGGFDPITPPAFAETVEESLSSDFSVVIPWGGHAAVASSQCADQMLIDFLADPQQQPDSSCIEAYEGIEWVTAGSLVRLPVINKLTNLEGSTGPQLLIYLLALLFLLSALLVYPIVWVVRRLSRPVQPAAAVPAQPEPFTPAPGYFGEPVHSANPFDAPAQSPAAPARRPLLYRLAPWISSAAGLALLAFTILITGVIFSLALSFDYRILMGLPGSARPIFILPILALLLALAMLVAAVIAWVRGAGSAWGRIYLSLLSVAALVCVGILAVWGMLGGLFA